MFDHAADVTEGDFWRNVEASIVQHPDLIVFDRICPVLIHISDWQRVTSCGESGRRESYDRNRNSTVLFILY